MTKPTKPDPKPLQPLGFAATAVLAAGVLACLWTGEWRWAVTGLVLGLVLAAAGAAVDGRKRRGPA